MSLTPGLALPFGIQPVNPVPVDVWSGPYSSILEANTSIPSAVRYQSLMVRIITGGVSKLYWYKNGILDIDLVEFEAVSSSSIDTLSDVTITSLVTGHFLRYNGSQWVNTLLIESDIPTLNWNKINNTPTTLIGYGITNAVDVNNTYTNPSWIGSLAASKITGVLSINNIPPSALERIYVYAGIQTLPENIGLTTNEVQNGDIVKINSTGLMYVVVDDTLLSSSTGYTLYSAGTAASVPFTGITGLPTTLSGYGITDLITLRIGDLTSGRIPFSSNNTTITDSDNLFWDNTNKKLLIKNNSTNLIEIKYNTINFISGSNNLSINLPILTDNFTINIPAKSGTLGLVSELNGILIDETNKTDSSILVYKSSLNKWVYEVGLQIPTLESGKFLSNNGTVLSWQTVVTNAAGNDKNVQFNNSGSFSGSDNFNWDKNENNLIINGLINLSTNTTIPSGYIYNSNFNIVNNDISSISLDTYTNTTDSAEINFRKSGGTVNSVTSTANNDKLGSIKFWDYSAGQFNKLSSVDVIKNNISSNILFSFIGSDGIERYYNKFNELGLVIGNNANNITQLAKLHIKGDGSTNSTTSIYVESTSDLLLSLKDNGDLNINNKLQFTSGKLILGPITNTWNSNSGAIQIFESSEIPVAHIISHANVRASGFFGRRFKGTIASPTAVSAADLIMDISGQAYNGINGFYTVASIIFSAAHNVTATNNSGNIDFYTTNQNSTNRTWNMRLAYNGNLHLGNPSANDSTSTKLAVFGIGTTSSTYSLWLANSAGTRTFSVDDTGDMYLLGKLSSSSLLLSGNNGDILFNNSNSISSNNNFNYNSTLNVLSTPKLLLNNNVLKTATSLTNISTNTAIIDQEIGNYRSLFFNYYITNGTSLRAGTIIAIFNNLGNIEYNETTTSDIGNTTPVIFSVTVTTTNILINMNPSSGTWNIKFEYSLM